MVETGMNARKTIALRIVHGATVSAAASTSSGGPSRPRRAAAAGGARAPGGRAPARGRSSHSAAIGTR